MKSRSGQRYLPLAVALSITFGECARADVAAVAFDTGTITVLNGGSGVWGWQFSTLVEIQVTALGIFDGPNVTGYGDGLLEPHEIGIWDIGAPTTPVVSSLIPSGTGASLQSNFRYVPVTPITLQAGHDYAIGALSVGLDNTTGGGGNNPLVVFNFGPGIEFGGRRWHAPSPGMLVFPERYEAGLEYEFGPNFTYTLVPEPSSLISFALGALVLVFATRRGG